MSAKLVCGAGANDADYNVHRFDVVDGKRVKVWTCPFYRAWSNMLKRCYSDKWRSKYPTYGGCKVCPEWLLFSAFKSWMSAEDWKGKQLDKDILVPGNKLYSPETCVFVSGELNNFLIDSAASRGQWPIGVSWHNGLGKFQARCSNPLTGKSEFLGYFPGPESAHEAWQKRKQELACQYASRQTDGRIAEALRKRYA